MDSDSRGLDLEKELTCSICTEVLYKPLTLLDCLHTFCGPCLKEWFKWQLSSFQNRPEPAPVGTVVYTCPSCRAPVRETKHNATVTTLLEMFLAAHPDKARPQEEQDDLNSKYTPGEDVIPKAENRQRSRRERRLENEDRRLLDEVRGLSLREVGVNVPEPRTRRRREDSRASDRSPAMRTPPRESSRSTRTSDHERRHRDEDGERRRRRTESAVSSSYTYREDRRRARNDEDRRRQEERPRTAERQIEHQSSLRSLISSSDVDTREMEEEILRQIHEEGLLDGIDLENIDVTQEDQISERIAEAFRRRMEERSREEAARRSRFRERSRDNRASSRNPSQTHSADERTRPPSSRRVHSRTPSSRSQTDEVPRPSTATSSSRLEIHSGDERRRRPRSSGARSATVSSSSPMTGSTSRPAARSQTDLSDIQQSARSREWVAAASQHRSATDPVVPRASESVPEPRPTVPSRRDSPREPSPAAQPVLNAEEAPVASPTSMPSSSPDEAGNLSDSEIFPPDIVATAPTPSLSLDTYMDPSLMPAPLSPSNPNRRSVLFDHTAASGSDSRPSSMHGRPRAQLFQEPSISCSRCQRPHIEYEVHYNCYKCQGGKWNICLSCYRTGAGCLHWFGFGRSAWPKWEAKVAKGEVSVELGPPHMLFASRYLPPRSFDGGAEGRRTLTYEDPEQRLQSGAFCSNCQNWANECFWSCDSCNEGDWGFCNLCVNRGKCCTHPLLPLTLHADTLDGPISPTQEQATPLSASILTGPEVIDRGRFKPLTFRTKCDICRYPIHPSEPRYHCYECTSKAANAKQGDYDICTSCYQNQVNKGRISAENGPAGWRRCLRGHRLIVAGFREDRGAEWRVIMQDQVGGNSLYEEPLVTPDHRQDLVKWSWADDTEVRLVTIDVSATAPSNTLQILTDKGPKELVLSKSFPPDGGIGMIAVASWGWYPQVGDGDNELLFPRGAEIKECKDMNGDWFLGSYMGSRGLLPAPYVHVIGNVTSETAK